MTIELLSQDHVCDLNVNPKRAKRNDDGAAVELFQQLCVSIDTPRSLCCYLLSKYSEWQQYLDLDCDAGRYLDPHSYFRDAQITSFLSKYPSLPGLQIDRRGRAYKKFLEAENQCELTNNRFREFWETGLISPSVGAVLHIAQRKISSILGPVPSLESLDFRFGPGASFGVRGDTSVYKKLSSGLEASASMLNVLPQFLMEFPGWLEPETMADITIVRGSELTFVPKNAKVDRPICIEPLLNGLYQKGVGSYIRKRLKSANCDIRSQSRNQDLASIAHIKGLATIDLSSASDTISYNLVQDLLPCEWFDFLECARCGRYSLEGKWFNFHKFSSMGNAYTFELETLLFLALSRATCDFLHLSTDDVNAYGDDIVIPRAAASLLQEVLSWCGFTMNTEKSFIDGQFFESCGHDYFFGCDVRPFYLKTRLKTTLDLYYAANTVSRIASKLYRLNSSKTGTLGRCRSLRDTYFRIVDSIPRGLRLLGPEGYGDGHLISDFDHARPSRARRGWDGWRYRTRVEQSILSKQREWPKAYSLYYAGLEAKASSGYARRGRTRIAEVTAVAPVWGYIGRWM